MRGQERDLSSGFGSFQPSESLSITGVGVDAGVGRERPRDETRGSADNAR